MNTFENFFQAIFRVIFIVVVLVVISITTYKVVKSTSSEPLIQIHVERAEDVRQHMVEEVERYIRSVAPYSEISADTIVDICIKYRIHPGFVLSQGQMESHFGTRGVATKTNSVFNINSFDGLSADQILASGKRYTNVNASVEPYAKILVKDYLDENHDEVRLLENFVSKKGYRYASDPNYEKNLRRIFSKIDSHTEITNLYKEYLKLDQIAKKL